MRKLVRKFFVSSPTLSPVDRARLCIAGLRDQQADIVDNKQAIRKALEQSIANVSAEYDKAMQDAHYLALAANGLLK